MGDHALMQENLLVALGMKESTALSRKIGSGLIWCTSKPSVGKAQLDDLTFKSLSGHFMASEQKKVCS